MRFKGSPARMETIVIETMETAETMEITKTTESMENIGHVDTMES